MKSAIYLFSLFLLVACVPSTVAPAEPTGLPTAVAALPTVFQPTGTSPATLTVAPYPTQTALATPTAFFSATLLPSLPSSTSGPVLPKVILTPDRRQMWFSAAPNGQWQATGIYDVQMAGEHAHEAHVQLLVRRARSALVWIVVDEFRSVGLGSSLPTVLAWSLDGQFVYISEASWADGGGIFEHHAGLWRLSLADGLVEELIAPETKDVALAPDGLTAVYLLWARPTDIFVRDIASGAEQIAQPGLPFDDLGALVWAPDSDQFALTLAADWGTADWQHTVAVFRRDTLAQTVLLADDRHHHFRTIAWPEPTTLWLVGQDGQRWELDVDSGEVTMVAE